MRWWWLILLLLWGCSKAPSGPTPVRLWTALEGGELEALRQLCQESP